MGLLTRIFHRDKPPAEALTGLDPDERVTAWALTGAGPAVVATPRGLWLPPLDEPGEPQRLSWDGIHKATWNGNLLTIVPSVEVEPGVVADGPAIRLRLPEPRGLAAEVRARVTRSVAHSEHRELPGGGLLIVARRTPGADGLNWVLRFDDGTDRTDPDVRLRAAELLDEVRATADLAT